MRRRSLADRIEEFEKLCRQKGLPLTVQRRAVLKALAQRSDHPTADQILEDVVACLPGVSRATVYRVLEALVEFGVARKVCHPGSAVRFEAETQRHHHLVCLKCNRMIDLRDSRFDSLPFPDPSRHGFTLSDYSIQFRGTCPKCSKPAADDRRRGRTQRPAAQASPEQEAS